MNINKIIQTFVGNEELEKEVIRQFYYFHEHPELSNHEYKTSKYIKDFLMNLGYVINEVPGTGFTAHLENGLGIKIGLRSELDALPIEENEYNLIDCRKIKSINKGCMHACGHDAHQTILLYTLVFLAKHKELWSGEVIGIFEEGEENGSGISPMLERCRSLNLDYIYGNHVFNEMETGSINIQSGPVMAAYGLFDFTIKSRGGHGSRPDRTINSIGVGSQIYNYLNETWLNSFDLEDIVTMAITKFNAGSTLNVIPSECNIGGTIRYFDKEIGNKAVRIIENAVIELCKLNKAQVIFNLLTVDSKPVINNEFMSEVAKKAIQQVDNKIKFVDTKWYASETFSEYSTICPTLFSLVGIKNEEKGCGAEHHNSKFQVDEDALFIGLKVMISISLALLKCESIEDNSLNSK